MKLKIGQNTTSVLNKVQGRINIKAIQKGNIMERLWKKVAWKLPKRIVYWCAIRLVCNATQGQYGDQIVPELTAMDALKRWPISP